jgi:hypothetical protein
MSISALLKVIKNFRNVRILLIVFRLTDLQSLLSDFDAGSGDE